MRDGVVIEDRYELRELLGRGGMAEIWLAHDDRLARPVAVKFLGRQFGEDPDALVRFFSEAQSVARIQHPGVVPVLDFGTFDDHPYLVMYYMPGGSLADVVGTPMPVERAVPIMERVSGAAGAAHKLGIVHRDIKPANILFDEDGNPRLADFGIALSVGTEHLTATGTAIGSPHYVSPEHAQGAPTTPRSDVYALGIVLYELLTGRKPFSGNITEIVRAHVDEIPPRPSTFAPEVSGEVDGLVMQCLAKDPDDRLADGAAMAEAIGALGIEGPARITPPIAPVVALGTSTDASDHTHTTPFDTAAQESHAQPATRRRRVVAAALAAALVIGAGAGLALVGAGGESDPADATEDDPHPRTNNDTDVDQPTEIDSSPETPAGPGE